jgi:hypothetical protein
MNTNKADTAQFCEAPGEHYPCGSCAPCTRTYYEERLAEQTLALRWAEDNTRRRLPSEFPAETPQEHRERLITRGVYEALAEAKSAVEVAAADLAAYTASGG